MFEIGMKEAKENEMNILDFSFAVIEAAVFLCYDRQIPDVLNLDEKMELLRFFDMYQIAHLKVCLFDTLTLIHGSFSDLHRSCLDSKCFCFNRLQTRQLFHRYKCFQT